MTDNEMQALIEKAAKQRAADEAQHIIDRHTNGYGRWAKEVKKKIHRSVAMAAVVLLLFTIGVDKIPLHIATTTTTMHNAVDDMELQSMYADVETFCNLGCSHSEVIDMIIDSETMIA